MALVAVVEDEQAISRLICLHLQSAGYEAKPYYTGDDFLRSLRTQIPDVLLLDWMLPGEHDGIGVLRQLRSHDKARTVPVIMLTAKGEELDRILGLEVGADDYLTKPFSFREMVSRVKAQLRRREWEKDDPTVRRHGVIAVYPNEHRVTVSGKNLSLSPKEYDILSKLMERPSWVLTREQLLESIWGADYEGEMRTVDMHMTNLRRKLEEAGAKDYIQTVRAVGYKMCDLK
ncbi:MAG: winged helix-turn-helix domain-containing protein [Candidatus Spyradocola sp.]|nr:winged helix-turn-helix domain-containing protein [Candidatus Spyradocola sp.]